jgi:F0F1-type ATP synthase epsilon subunit
MAKKDALPRTIKVIAREPFHIYYEGEAHSVSANNDIGPFDVLPGHADFFSVLSPGEIIIETASEPIKFDLHNGMLIVQDNEIMIFANM